MVARRLSYRECVMSSKDFVPPLAANMNAAFKKVSGALDDDPVLGDQIATTIVELAKVGVYDVEELSSRTLSSLLDRLLDGAFRTRNINE
jgi:hypothetical protein